MSGEYSCAGFCRTCGTIHRLPFGRAREYAGEVIEEFKSLKRLDYLSNDEHANPKFSFEKILPGDRGHMFGVMECRDKDGETIWLRAFSSLGGGLRDVPGWVPYVLDTADFDLFILPGQLRIKELTKQRNALPSDDPERVKLGEKRRAISRELMVEIHDRYRFRNFAGRVEPLRNVFHSEGGIPGGVGDCCAPKLLHYAATHELRPVSVAEFYWGGNNKSGRKKPGQFFEACREKCQPILGFLLCGLENHE